MKRNSKLLLTAILLYSIGRVAIFIFAITKADRVANPIIPTIMLAFYFAFSAIFGLIFGKLSDRIRKRNIFNIFGSLSTVGIYFLYIFASDPIFLILLHSIIGIVYSASVPTSQALFSEMEPEIEHGTLMSYYNGISSVGWAVGALLGGLIAEFYGDMVFVFCSIVTFSAMVVIIFVKDVPFESRPNKITISVLKDKSEYINIQTKRILIILCLVILFRHLTAQGAVVALLPNWLARLGANELESSLILSVNMITQIFIMVPIGKLTDKIGRKPVLGIGVACAGLGAFLYSFATDPWFIAPVQMLIAVSWCCVIISGTAIVTDITKREHRSTGMGWLNAGLSIGGTIGPLTSGFLLYFFSYTLHTNITIGGIFDPLINIFSNGNLVFILTFQIISLFSIVGIIILLKLKEDRTRHEYSW
ncbi:MAG: MFS transporter [Candidatus Helarchaeota archaeon]